MKIAHPLIKCFLITSRRELGTFSLRALRGLQAHHPQLAFNQLFDMRLLRVVNGLHNPPARAKGT